MKDPDMEITGLISGERSLNFIGHMTIIDHINKLELVVTYNPSKQERGGMLSSFKKKFWGKKGEQLSDAVLIQIYQKALNGNSKEKVVVAEGSGSWLEYIQFDGKVYWTVEDEKPEWRLMNDEVNVSPRLRDYMLPSDS